MTNPAVWSDVDARWLFDSAIPDPTKVQAWLDAAWRELLRRDRSIDARLTAGTLLRDDVVDVIAAMALRVLGNPQGKRQESIDDYSYTRDNAVSSGGLYVTDAELASLASASVSGARNSVRLVIYGDA